MSNYRQFKYFNTKERTAVYDTGHPVYQVDGRTMSINIPDLPIEVFHCGIFKYLTDVDILNISRAGNVRLKEIATDYLKCKEPENYWAVYFIIGIISLLLYLELFLENFCHIS